MDLGVLPNNKHILDWDESDVHQWFMSIGYPQYEAQVKGSTLNFTSIYSASYLQQLTRYEAIRYALSIRKVSSH